MQVGAAPARLSVRSRLSASRQVLTVFLVGFGLLAVTGLTLIHRIHTTGDEPWYLLQAYALLHWHSVNLAPALHNHQVYARFLGTTPDDHTFDYLHNGVRVLFYMPGYAAAIAPFYAIGGLAAVVALQALAAALTGALVFGEARRIFGSTGVAVFAWLAYLSPLPVLDYAGQVFPSTLASCAIFLGFVLLRRWLPAAHGRRLWGVCAAIGVIAFALPWLHMKYAVSALTLAALAVLALWPRLRRDAPVAARRQALYAAGTILTLTAASFATIALYSHSYFGLWLPPNARQQPNWQAPHPQSALQLYSDMFLGRESGLLPWAPVYLLVPLGLAWLVYRYPREGRAILALVLAQLATFAAAAVTRVFQGTALPARFTVDLAPFFALCAAAVFSMGMAPLRAQIMAGVARVRRVALRAPQRAAGWRGAGLAVVAFAALALLGMTGWLAAAGQIDPALLYPAPSGVRLAEKYPGVVPQAWFALFPPGPGGWITQGAPAPDPTRSDGLLIHDGHGHIGYLAMPTATAHAATVMRTRPMLMPPGRYRATAALACDRPATAGVAAHLIVGRYGTRLADHPVSTQLCAGASHTVRVSAVFPSDGYSPITFEVHFDGETTVVVWSVTYAPSGS